MIHGLLCCLLGVVQSVGAADLRADLQRHFDAACQPGEFIGVVAVSVKGQLIFSAACGVANAEWNVKNAVDTRFRIGSITKELTAAAVLLLHEERRFSLTDPIGKYVANLPASWQTATIHQLLTHTSGVPIYTASADYSRVNPELDRINRLGATPNALLDLVRSRPLMFPNGTKFTYNNTGYILLGMLIESVSGTPYPRFIQERVFDHVGMKDSGFDATGRIVPKRAQGYAPAAGDLRHADFVDATVAWSAGGFYSTVGDLTRWAESLARGTLLNADSTGRMFRPYQEAASQDPFKKTAHYGYGVVLAERFGHQLQYHGGGISGFNSVLQRYPDVELTIAVLSNLDSDALPSWTLGDGLAGIWFGAQGK